MQSYRELIVWQKSMDLVTAIYKLTTQLPSDEKFGLIPQIKIPSNIAEGYGRNYRKDYSRFLQVARGSLFENQTQWEIAINLSFIKADDLKEVKELSVEIEKMLNSLIKKLET